MQNFDRTNGTFLISTDKTRLDIPYIHKYLRNSYWAEAIPLETVIRSIGGSLCFGVYDGERQVGFARVISDMATFAYLADVFIDIDYQGKGLGKWLIEVIMADPRLQGLRRFMLATRDAHTLYAQYGFVQLTHTERWMHIHRPGAYKKSGNP